MKESRRIELEQKLDEALARVETDVSEIKLIVTNVPSNVVVTEQNNPLQNELVPLHKAKKAAKKSEKNLEKVLKELNKAKKKASDEDEAELYQSLIDNSAK